MYGEQPQPTFEPPPAREHSGVESQLQPDYLPREADINPDAPATLVQLASASWAARSRR
jgi:hypothetical protein